jgi:hypothetical protein
MAALIGIVWLLVLAFPAWSLLLERRARIDVAYMLIFQCGFSAEQAGLGILLKLRKGVSTQAID